jgi:alkylhydroperoxidase family enzyme
MSRIRLLTLDELLGTRLRPHVERSLEERAPDPGFFAVMGHAPEIAEAVYAFWMDVFTTGTLDHRLKEIVRVNLSRLAGCHY